jgi:hypothetical protein
MYTRFTPPYFGKWLPSSGGRRFLGPTIKMILPQQAKLLNIYKKTPNIGYYTQLYGLKRSLGPGEFNLTTSTYKSVDATEN